MRAQVENYRKASKSLNDLRSDLEGLRLKKLELQNEVDDLKIRSEKAGKIKEQAIESFLLNHSDKFFVNEKEAQYQEVSTALQRSEQLLAVLLKREQEMHSQLPRHQGEVIKFSAELWDILEKDFRPGPELQNEIWRSFAAHRRGRRPLMYTDFFLTLFGEPDRDQLKEFNGELQAKFDATVR